MKIHSSRIFHSEVSLLVRPIPGFHLNDLLNSVELRALDRSFGFSKPNQVGFRQ